jgi:hypothetical protein
LESTYKKVINKPDLTIADHQKKVVDLIYELADEIEQETHQEAELESKIILSIAIRLKAEKFMIARINDQAFVGQIEEHQTGVLLTRFKKDFFAEACSISLLEQVSLMTPENIHLNSFMYEPILDMSPERLKNLYHDIKAINSI